jgi:hypothetical protein
MSENTRTTEDQQSLAHEENQEPIENQASAPEAELDAIPEKFVGKSALEVIQAYNNLEKHASKVSSERSEERKKREELEGKVRDLETQFQSIKSQPARHEQRQEPESDPFAEYEEQFDNNPKEAIKGIVKKVRQEVLSDSERRLMQEEQLRAQDYHRSQRTTNPEYAKLEPTMAALASEFGDLVDPAKASSVKALKLLHLAAKGAKLEDYVSEAASKAKKESHSVREEKRNAFSESSASSKAEGKKSIKDMTVEEIEALYPVARD